MKYYKLKYPNGDFKIVKEKNSLDVIKKYDLYIRENNDIVMMELEGEQKAIAMSNDMEL